MVPLRQLVSCVSYLAAIPSFGELNLEVFTLPLPRTGILHSAF